MAMAMVMAKLPALITKQQMDALKNVESDTPFH